MYTLVAASGAVLLTRHGFKCGWTLNAVELYRSHRRSSRRNLHIACRHGVIRTTVRSTPKLPKYLVFRNLQSSESSLRDQHSHLFGFSDSVRLLSGAGGEPPMAPILYQRRKRTEV